MLRTYLENLLKHRKLVMPSTCRILTLTSTPLNKGIQTEDDKQVIHYISLMYKKCSVKVYLSSIMVELKITKIGSHQSRTP